MTSTTPETAARARAVEVTDEFLVVRLDDGRRISVPLEWYPRLLHGTPDERSWYRVVGSGVALHWPDLDEDLHVQALLEGRRSGENARSLQRWMDRRRHEDPR